MYQEMAQERQWRPRSQYTLKAEFCICSHKCFMFTFSSLFTLETISQTLTLSFLPSLNGSSLRSFNKHPKHCRMGAAWGQLSDSWSFWRARTYPKWLSITRDAEQKDGSARPQGCLQPAELGEGRAHSPAALMAACWWQSSCLEPYWEALFYLITSFPASGPEYDQTWITIYQEPAPGADHPSRAHLYSITWTKCFHVDAFM